MSTKKKNVQVIDGALNCTYDVFAASENDFGLMFPETGQDVEFIEDFIDRLGKEQAGRVTARLFSSRMDKKLVKGIHGTLFYELTFKKKFYPTKRESEMVTGMK